LLAAVILHPGERAQLGENWPAPLSLLRRNVIFSTLVAYLQQVVTMQTVHVAAMQ
jgi:hypothetical protein